MGVWFRVCILAAASDLVSNRLGFRRVNKQGIMAGVVCYSLIFIFSERPF